MDNYLLEKIESIKKELQLIEDYVNAKNEMSKQLFVIEQDKCYTTIDKDKKNIVDFKRRNV